MHKMWNTTRLFTALKIALSLLVVMVLFGTAQSFAATKEVAVEGHSNLTAVILENQNAPQDAIDFEKDFVRLSQPVKVKTDEGEKNVSYFYFQDSLSAAELEFLGGQNNLKLEYHSITSEKETFVHSPYYNENLSLGVMGNFHVVGFDKVDLGGTHTNGNVLAKDFASNTGFGTNGFDGQEATYVARDYQANTANAGSSSRNPLVVSHETKLGFMDNGNAVSINGHKLDRPSVIYRDSAKEKFLSLSSLEKEAKSISKDLADLPQTEGVEVDNRDQNNRSITIKNVDGVNVVNMTAAELNSYANNKLDLKGFQSGQMGSLVINVDMTGVSSLRMPQKAWIFIDGQQRATNEVTEFSAGKVIWNFVNAKGATITTCDEMTGIIMAPESEVHFKQVNGNIVANKAVHEGAESHRTDFTGKVHGDEEALLVQKEFKGEWPEGKSFTFHLEGMTDNTASLSRYVTVTKNAASKGFGAIHFAYHANLEGTQVSYVYCVTENHPGTDNGITYDASAYFVRYTVAYQEALGGASVVKTEIYHGDKDWNYESNQAAWEELEADDQVKFTFTNSIKGEEVEEPKDDNPKGEEPKEEPKTEEPKEEPKTEEPKEEKPEKPTTPEDKTPDKPKDETPDKPKDETPETPKDETPKEEESIQKAIVRIAGVKTLEGADLEEGQFRFELKDQLTNTVIDTASNDEDGNFYFGNLSYEKAGKYYYTVSEQQGGLKINGVNYDQTEVQVTVSVEAEGKGFVATVKANTGDKVTFTNEKLRDIAVSKVWEDNDDQAGARPSKITVKLMKDGKAVSSLVLSEENQWKGAFYDLPADQQYSVEEEAVEGYTSKVVKKDDGDAYTITNTYVHGTVSLKVKKELEGATLEAGAFLFDLYKADKNGKAGEKIATQSNGGDGYVIFEDVPYNAEGYVVQERKGSVSQISYDTEPRHITLNAQDQQAKVPTITNVYHQVMLTVQKTSKDLSDGKEPLEGAVYGLHALKNGADVLLAKQTSDAEGKMYFSEVEVGTGVVYFFKEISAPAGHTVDPHGAGYFKLEWNKNATGVQMIPCDENGKALASANRTANRLHANAAGDTLTDRTFAVEAEGVADRTTGLEVGKRDRQSGELLEGAKFQIVEKETGNVVASWTSSAESREVINKVLDVNVRYLLQEVEAPEGYELAEDTEFSLDDYGNITVYSQESDIVVGDKTQSNVVDSTTLDVYDARTPLMKMYIHKVYKETGGETVYKKGKVKTVYKQHKVYETQVVKTGDNTRVAGYVVALVAALAILAALVVYRRRRA